MSVRCGALEMVVTATVLSAAAPVSGQLVSAGNHRIFQNQVGGAIEEGDRFGDALATGDFDGDGFDDLAIGTPEEDLGAVVDAGAVFVIYGSVAGLGFGAVSPLLIHQDVAGVEGVAETGDRFGSVLLAGDFNGDGRDELVVGIPDEDVGALVDAGAIQVFLGTAGGLTTSGDALWTRGSFPSVADEQGYRFGASLASGYLAAFGDANLDLVVGTPGGALAPTFGGSVMQVAGGPSGLGADSFHAFSPTNDGDLAGSAVGIGDVDGDGLPGDLVIGAPFAEFGGGNTNDGLVWIATQSGPGYLPISMTEAESHMGSPIVFGDFRGAGHPQLLIGAPDADVELEQDSGAVVLYDGQEHIFLLIKQDLSLTFNRPEPFDHFGGVLAAGDFDADGYDDAVFGVPHENLLDAGGADVPDAGIVQVLHGRVSGLRYDNNQQWWFNILDFGLFPDDNFGAALAAGDFDGDGADDLAIGAPGAFWSGAPGTGVVQILYGTGSLLFADDFESGNPSAWTSTFP